MAVLIGSGLQIVALDMYQDNMNSREPYIKRIYASHAQVVCLALSLFLLHMHDVVITCNMRNAESSILRLALQVGCAGHASALGWRVEHRFGHLGHYGDLKGAQSRPKEKRKSNCGHVRCR